MATVFYFLFFLATLICESLAFKRDPEYTDVKKRLDAPYSTMNDADKNQYVWVVIYKTMTLVGLFSDQWIVFVLALATGVLSNTLRKYYAYRVVDASISILLALFMLINHYHLKLNLLSLIS